MFISHVLAALMAGKTSADNNKFLATDVVLAREENKTHLRLRLLSLSSLIFLLKSLIFFFIIFELDIEY